MSIRVQVFCDGCGATLTDRQRVIKGRRLDGMGGGGLPDRDFDWCRACATTAFSLLRDALGKVEKA